MEIQQTVPILTELWDDVRHWIKGICEQVDVIVTCRHYYRYIKHLRALKGSTETKSEDPTSVGKNVTKISGSTICPRAGRKGQQEETESQLWDWDHRGTKAPPATLLAIFRWSSWTSSMLVMEACIWMVQPWASWRWHHWDNRWRCRRKSKMQRTEMPNCYRGREKQGAETTATSWVWEK